MQYPAPGASSSKAIVPGASSSKVLPPREQDAPATWQYFNPATQIDIRRGGNLPHWEQGSVWYFVTFRLADSLPLAALEEIREKRERWKQSSHINNLSRAERSEYYRLYSVRYEELLHAGRGSCVLCDPQIAAIVDDALHHFEGRRYLLDEYVIMPNHVHILVRPVAGHRLANILHSWKSFTANRINKKLGKSGPLWMHESYDHIVRHERAMEAIRRYIREQRYPELPAPGLPNKGAGCSRYREHGCCWVRQWMAPSPQITSRQSMGTILRVGKASRKTPSARESLGSPKTGSRTEVFAI